MKCPVCSDMRLIVSDRHGIAIDYCPQCRGVWLDRGELDKLVERSIGALPPEPPAPLGSPPLRGNARDGVVQDGDAQKRRKNLLAELFDF